jgi:hypothetical protein
MTLDELARAAAAEARLAAAHQIDAMTMLAELRHRSRRRTAAAAIAVVAAVCVAVVVALLMVGPGKPTSTRPASTEHPHPSSTSTSVCRGGPPIQCLSGRRVLVSLPVPVTVHVPMNFDQNASLCGSSGLIVYRNDSYGTGVTVIENAVPVRYDSSWHRDRSAGTSVSSIAHWLSARPFFAHTSVKPVTVDGLAGRQISGELKPAAELPADYPSVGQVAPTFTGNGDCHAAAGRGLFGTYTVVQVPGAGVTVIWSWTINRDHALIAGNQPLIDGLSFG